MDTAEAAERLESVETAPCTCAAPPWMSVPEAAEVLGKSREYLYAGLREDRFPGVKFGRSWSLPREFIKGFVAEAFELGRAISFEDYAASWSRKTSEGAA